jgi:hypothetical protein
MITLPIGYLIQMEISSTRKEENTIHTLKEMDISSQTPKKIFI